MNISTPRLFAIALIASTFFGLCSCIAEDNDLVREDKASEVGFDVAIYAAPLVMMDIAKRYDTQNAQVNQFVHASELITPRNQKLAFPNVDVLSSNAWLDLSSGPIVMHLPAIRQRYYLFELIDSWTTVFATVDPYTTDRHPQDVVICGPSFPGKVEGPYKVVRSATDMVQVKGRIQCYSKFDVDGVTSIQKQLSLKPLRPSEQTMIPTKWGQVGKMTPRDQVLDMNANTYFTHFATLLQTNPPTVQDGAMLAPMAHLGIGVGKKFIADDTDPAVFKGLEEAFSDLKDQLATSKYKACDYVNNWDILNKMAGRTGTDYSLRADIASVDLGASLAENILCPFTGRDTRGNRLTGTRQYYIHFSKEDLSQANAFWSLTLYDDSDKLVANPIDTYAIQSFDNTLVYNADGSLDILIQREKPSRLAANWLPAPDGLFKVMLRLYRPKAAVVDGSWYPPTVHCSSSLD